MPKSARIEVKSEVGGAVKGLEDVEKALDKVGKKAEATSNGIGKMSGAMDVLASTQIGGMIGSFAADIGRMGIACIQSAAKMKQYEIAFQTMLKSASAGKQMLKDLQTFAANTPFDVPGVVSAGQQLMAFGFQAEEVIPMLTALGDTAAGLGKGTAGVGQLAYALGQMRTSGTLKTQDMMQLTTAGVNAWEILAEASGKTVMEIKELTEKGAIDSTAAVEVIVGGMTEKFGGMMAKTADEVTGLMANIEETVGTTAAVLGSYMTEAFNVKGILKTVSEALGEFQDKMRSAQEAGKSFGEAIRESVPAPLIVAIGALAGVLGGVFVASTIAATTALAGFLALSGPVVAGFAAVGVALAGLIVYWDEVKAAFCAGCEAIATIIFGAMTAIVDVTKWMVDTGLGYFADFFNISIGFCPEWLSDFNKMLDSALESIRSWATEALEWFREVFKAKSKAEGKEPEPDTPIPTPNKKPETSKPTTTKPLFVPTSTAGTNKATSSYAGRNYSDATKPYDESLRKLREKYNTAKQYASEERRLEDEKLRNINKANQATLTGMALKKAQHDAEMDMIKKKIDREKEDSKNYIANLEAQKKVLEEQKAAGLLDGSEEKLTAIDAQIAKEKELHNMRLETLGTQQVALEANFQSVSNLSKLYEQFGEHALGGVSDAFSECIMAGKSFSTAMGNLVRQMMSEVMALIAKWLILRALMGIGGSIGAWAGKTHDALFAASGGYIKGPGTGTSDSIPAMLSNGEYVLNANAVNQLGVPLLNGLNSGNIDGFAKGGYIGHVPYNNNGSSSNMAAVSNSNVNLNVSAMDAESFMGFLNGGGLDSLRQALFDNERNFGSEAGVW